MESVFSTGMLNHQPMTLLIKKKSTTDLSTTVHVPAFKSCFYFDGSSAQRLPLSSPALVCHQSDRHSASCRLINDIYVRGKLLLSANHRICESAALTDPRAPETNGGTGSPRNLDAMSKRLSAASGPPRVPSNPPKQMPVANKCRC